MLRWPWATGQLQAAGVICLYHIQSHIPTCVPHDWAGLEQHQCLLFGLSDLESLDVTSTLPLIHLTTQASTFQIPFLNMQSGSKMVENIV